MIDEDRLCNARTTLIDVESKLRGLAHLIRQQKAEEIPLDSLQQEQVNDGLSFFLSDMAGALAKIRNELDEEEVNVRMRTSKCRS